MPLIWYLYGFGQNRKFLGNRLIPRILRVVLINFCEDRTSYSWKRHWILFLCYSIWKKRCRIDQRLSYYMSLYKLNSFIVSLLKIYFFPYDSIPPFWRFWRYIFNPNHLLFLPLYYLNLFHLINLLFLSFFQKFLKTSFFQNQFYVLFL